MRVSELKELYGKGERNFREVDLRDADLRDADLAHTNMRRSNLRHANLEGADLRYADLTGADLRGAFLSSRDSRGGWVLDRTEFPVDGERLVGARIDGWSLRDVVATLGSTFSEQQFTAWVAMQRSGVAPANRDVSPGRSLSD